MVANTQNRLPRDLETVVNEEDTRIEKYEGALTDEIKSKEQEIEDLDQKEIEEE